LNSFFQVALHEIIHVAGAVRECEGIEYVELLVEGQSFIIHQIRKMVGLAVSS